MRGFATEVVGEGFEGVDSARVGGEVTVRAMGGITAARMGVGEDEGAGEGMGAGEAVLRGSMGEFEGDRCITVAPVRAARSFKRSSAKTSREETFLLKFPLIGAPLREGREGEETTGGAETDKFGCEEELPPKSSLAMRETKSPRSSSLSESRGGGLELRVRALK